MNHVENSWPAFFKPGDSVLALPCWKRPRLYIASQGVRQRWQDSEFYPAFKLHAKLFKLAIRMLAAFGLLPSRKMNGVPSSVPGWTENVAYERMALLVGVPGPTQKLIARCLDASGKPVAYVKYGETARAVEKIGNEADVLNKIPGVESAAPMAPRMLWLGTCGNGMAVAISAVEGHMLPARLPPLTSSQKPASDRPELNDMVSYLEQLKTADRLCSIDEHPAIARLRQRLRDGCELITESALDEILLPLRSHSWPIVIQHGDFTPWNIIRLKPNTQCRTPMPLCAIDWEEGTTEGFPCFDLIYHILQTGFLIHQWNPQQVFSYAQEALAGRFSAEYCPLSTRQAASLIRLAALDACIRFESRTGEKAQALQAARLDIVQLNFNPKM